MSRASRLTVIETRLGDVVVWLECQKIAAELKVEAQELFEEMRGLAAKYLPLQRPVGGGKFDLEPMLRAMADGEGWDYDELVSDTRTLLRRRHSRR